MAKKNFNLEFKTKLITEAFQLGYGEGYADCENETVEKDENLKTSPNMLKCEILEDLSEYGMSLARLSKQMDNLKLKVSKLSHI